MAPPSWITVLASAIALIGTGCVMGGDDPPGCRADHPEDCDEGWSCRAGVCVHPTTPLSSPEAGTDAAAE